MLKIYINIIKNNKNLRLWIKNGEREFSEEELTPGQGFDNMLITSLDKILLKNTIRKSSLKSLEIQGEIRKISSQGMILRAVKEAIGDRN